MRKKLYFDNNAWDILFEFNVNINSELPSSEYEILITKEAEFEIPGMPAEKRDYVDKSMKLSDVKTDIYFGHYNPALPSNEQRVTGYGSLGNNEAGGRYATIAEDGFLKNESSTISKIKKKTGLFGNEADVSLGARSLIEVVVTGDDKKALKRARARWGGSIIDIKKYDGSIPFGDFLTSEIAGLRNDG